MSLKQLKEFTSTTEVTVEDLIDTLDLWEQGQVTDEEVMLLAEGIYDAGPGFPSYPEDDPRFVIVNVLDAFVMMYSNPTTKADIPALRKSLEMCTISPSDASQYLKEYWTRIDREERLHKQTQWIENRKLGLDE